ncbi:hypothetical protein Ancab_025297, partial [Ancistrocladus abbreviatus]
CDRVVLPKWVGKKALDSAYVENLIHPQFFRGGYLTSGRLFSSYVGDEDLNLIC